MGNGMIISDNNFSQPTKPNPITTFKESFQNLAQQKSLKSILTLPHLTYLTLHS